jgi:AsmA protein
MRALKITGAAIAAVILIVVVALLVGIPSGFLTSAIQDRVERQSGFRLTIAGSTKISVWPTLNVSLNDLTLQDPKDRDTSRRVTIGNLQADVTLSSIWSGHPHVSELIITKPVVSRTLLRERTVDAPSRTTQPETESGALTIDRVKIVEGVVIASNARDRFERRIDGINATAILGADRNMKITGTARTSDSPLKFDVKALAPAGQNIPVELTLEAPGFLRAPLTAKAEVRFASPLIKINSLSGAIGDGAFNGWASLDLASKPLVKVDLDFQRLALGSSTTTASTTAPEQGWSDEPINLTGLNYVDAQVRLSAAQLDLGSAQFAPVAIDATLAGGVLKASFSNLGVYSGQANGEVIVDASSGSPTYAMHCDLVGVRALPLLTSLADFDKVDGRMMTKIALRSAGASQHAIMAGMSGTVFVVFQDGQIRGLNLAQMIRSLTSSPLNGWQEQQDQGTDLTQLSSSFKIDRGQAVTTDFSLVGPLVKVTGAGTLDLGTKMMGARIEPKLVMTTQGQGRTADPVAFGVPVMIEGPWSSPRIYPDMQGIMDNPDGAYAKLREMGKGLFGPNGGGLGGMLGGLSALTGNGNNATTGNNGTNDQFGGIGAAIGNLLQKGLGNPSRSLAAPTEQQPAPQVQAPAPPDQQAQSDTSGPQDSQPMNDVLKQLFNR